ncbi:MAG: CinA family nicotinamide mononucleotide deamidase-related protein [Bacilli bacterium]|nr:CinA family nicotinamide mononucleotide deamidase-related protein [Bacilli bacterium]
MRAFILNIGDELLSGKTINTNSSFLAEELAKLSITVEKIVVVGDDVELIKKEVEWFRNSDLDIFISTGGLGPTHDDLSKETITEALGLDMVLDEKTVNKINKYFNNNAPKSNLKQAYFPKNGVIVENNLGTAPGVIINHERKHYFILVGPPYELKPMFLDTCMDYLKDLQDEEYLFREYIVMGGGESFFEDLLINLLNSLKNVSLNPYASIGKIRYVIKANKIHEEEYLQVINTFEEIMDKYIISKDNEEVEEVLFKLLEKHNYKISFSESITGGMLASKFINVSGASRFLSESFVTYSNEAKIKYLGVDPKTIADFSEVSPEVARQMVIGLKKRTKTEVALALTGYAGPTGRDVGLVYYGIMINDKLFISKERFRGNREMIRLRATLLGMYKLVRHLKEEN